MTTRRKALSTPNPAPLKNPFNEKDPSIVDLLNGYKHGDRYQPIRDDTDVILERLGEIAAHACFPDPFKNALKKEYIRDREFVGPVHKLLQYYLKVVSTLDVDFSELVSAQNSLLRLASMPSGSYEDCARTAERVLGILTDQRGGHVYIPSCTVSRSSSVSTVKPIAKDTSRRSPSTTISNEGTNNKHDAVRSTVKARPVSQASQFKYQSNVTSEARPSGQIAPKLSRVCSMLNKTPLKNQSVQDIGRRGQA